MENISPEILHIVCSFLRVDDVLSFRLVGRSFADIGAAYMLPEVTFYMHDEELRRLREISLHPVFSRHVCSLTYFAHALDSPKVTFREFVRDHRRELRWNRRLRRRNLSTPQLMVEYRKYEEAADRQAAIMTAQTDIDVLKEFYEGRIRKKRPKPLDNIMRGRNLYSLNPEGARPLEALMSANAEAQCDIRSFRAGSLNWRFFRHRAADLARLFRPLAHLTRIELNINVDPADERARESDSAARCRRVLGRGVLREILRSMPALQSLCVELVSWDGDDLDRGAALRDVVEPGFRWPQLRELVIGGVDCERQDIMDVLELHKDTLRHLCLRSIYLKTTSWKKLLPDIRKKLYLTDACICGDLYGHPEEDDEDLQGEAGAADFSFWPIPHLTPDLEYWDLSVPEVGCHDMRESINVYCRQGGALYPDELPLNDEVVDKHFDEYVKSVMEYDGDEYDDDHDSTMSAFNDLGLSDDDDDDDGKEGGANGGRRDDDDSNWEDVDSADEDYDEDEDDDDELGDEFGYDDEYGYFLDDDDDDGGFGPSLGLNPVEFVLGMFMGGPTQW
ncbi:hypothetical protein UCREL1_545 [Eutypa lata UCREL1]|uniref:F-box domain-containing protein n=1 Tax=Eutypa lata (strain UCR-EL1) TaxID=1287681 RepID=M7T680_EUTLA|nr:hypothetical protein UCREL1_545 [Eutypa lata UCREL1]